MSTDTGRDHPTHQLGYNHSLECLVTENSLIITICHCHYNVHAQILYIYIVCVCVWMYIDEMYVDVHIPFLTCIL